MVMKKIKIRLGRRFLVISSLIYETMHTGFAFTHHGLFHEYGVFWDAAGKSCEKIDEMVGLKV